MALRLDPNLSLAYAVRGEVQADMVPVAAQWAGRIHRRAFRVQSSMMGQMPRPSYGAVQTTRRWGTSTAQYKTTNDVWISIPRMKSAGDIFAFVYLCLGRHGRRAHFYEMELEMATTQRHSSIRARCGSARRSPRALSTLALQFRTTRS